MAPHTAIRYHADLAPPPGSDGLISVAIVDDQPVTRAGMEQALAGDPDLTVVASVDSVGDLPAGSRADVAIIALPLVGDGPAAVASAAAIAHPLVTSIWDGPATLLHAIRAGARGCITRHSDPETVRTAVGVIARGGFYLCSRLVGQFQAGLVRASREDGHVLAPREVETIRLIALGFTQAQIATRMGLTQATVNTYTKRIRSKLNVNNKAELTRMAIELGYLDDRRHVAA
ncbi:response regulator transcription factor [Rhizomonospora bruguierae]|uniref:response regulator transcription factor n=1 Tax=Rhizomonospora bruguierae TaxID=1581705 RepID=UPI001BCF1A18|nr:response regulator transcription factor [Micromonospora sp. NBRC 107566]